MKYLQTNFSGCGFFIFRDFAPFHFPSDLANFIYGPWTIGCQKIGLAQKFYADRG